MAPMKAAVMPFAGGSSQDFLVKLVPRPIPTKPGEVLIKVMAFGLNRSEMYTRQGLSPTVTFPRILGIEAAGVIESAPGGEFQKGDVVATAMGGMGRDFDGGYAEYTVVPAKQVQTVSTSLSWEKLGALPELMNTVWGSLFKSLRLEKDDHFLIRGGTSSVGLAAAAIAKNYGMYPVKMAFPRWPVGCEFVAVTTRNQARVEQLKKTAHEIYLEDGNIAAQVAASHPQKFSKILELVGTATMEDSLRCAQDNGIVCVTGMAGGQWVAKKFSPLYAIPTSVCLTSFRSEVGFMSTPLENIAQMMAEGKLEFPIRTYTLDQISQAHQDMEDSNVMGKAVILLGEH